MAVDKLVDSGQLDSDLEDIADAIRAKGGTSAQLAFPSGFVSAIEAIPSGGGTTWETVYNDTVAVTISEDDYYLQTITFGYSINQNTIWKITWNGTPYECTATSIGISDFPPYAIGNDAIIHQQGGNNEPFFMQKTDASTLVVVSATSQTVSLKIEKQVSGGATLITKSITANGTYDAEDDDADGYSSVTVNVSGGGGLVYETGTYTPTSDVASATVSFTNTHSTLPAIVVMAEASNSLSSWTNYSLFEWNYINTGDLFGGGYPRSSAYLGYGRVDVIRKSNTSSLNVTNTISFQYPSSETSDANETYPRYWVTASSFKAYSSNNTYYWRSGRTYKWIAVWAPTT